MSRTIARTLIEWALRTWSLCLAEAERFALSSIMQQMTVVDRDLRRGSAAHCAAADVAEHPAQSVVFAARPAVSSVCWVFRGAPLRPDL